MAHGNPNFPDSANHPSLALRGAESCAGSSCCGFALLAKGWPRNDESPAWRLGLSLVSGNGAVRPGTDKSETPPIS